MGSTYTFTPWEMQYAQHRYVDENINSVKQEIQELREELKSNMSKIREEIDEIRQMVLYAPGGPMFQVAKNDFEDKVHPQIE